MTERISFILFAAILLPTPAFAADTTQIPEASSATLLALGVLGVIIGRYASKRRSNRED